jgi:hypothetical protein
MHPNIHICWLAIAAAVVASFFFEFLWYGPILGKAWAKEMKMSMDKKPDAAFMRRAMGLTLFGTFLTAYVLLHVVEVWRGSVWGASAQDMCACSYGFFGGFFTWLGFYVPQNLACVAWEKRSWKLFSINVGGHFIKLQIMAMILAYWR